MFNSLIEEIKKQFLYFIAFRFYLKSSLKVQSYAEFASNASKFLVLMPEDTKDFDYALELVKKILLQKKSIVLLLKDNQVSYLKTKADLPYISVDKNSLNKLHMPSKDMLADFRAKEFDIAIDLNTNENIFYSILTSLAHAKFRIGFKKRNSEKFYNLIIINNEINPAISYRNLLNSLQMF
ncbi:MAG: DUF6913 domain-containing protein [Bacillota bacterium]